MVVLAVPILVGLGLWQLQRAQWKAEILAVADRNAAKPPLDLGAGPLPETDLRFRRVSMVIDCPRQPAQPRAGRSAMGQSGYRLVLTCSAAATPLLLDAGWSPRPDVAPASGEAWEVRGATVQGVLVPVDREEARWMLVAETGVQGLPPSLPPGPETIPDNHRLYAVQWFSFAAILVVIYGAYALRWRRNLAPAPPGS